MKVFFYLIGILLLIACNQKNQPHIEPEFSEDYNKCFSIENGYPDFIYTDTLITSTEKGNFIKKISITDSTYMRVVGRGNIEYTLDTVACKGLPRGGIDWETDEFIAYIHPCGTYCWGNTVFSLKEKKEPLKLSYSTVDLETMNALSVTDKEFVITNLRTQKEERLPIEDIDCVNGYPLFSVHDIELSNDTIYYTLKCKYEADISNKIDVRLYTNRIQEP